MITAIVFIQTSVDAINEAASEIASIAGVSEVYSVTGEHDLIAMIRVRSHDAIADVVAGSINKVPGVTQTQTQIAFRTFSRHDLEGTFSIGLD